MENIYQELAKRLNKPVNEVERLLPFIDENMLKIIEASFLIDVKNYSEADAILPNFTALIDLDTILHPNYNEFCFDENEWRNIKCDIEVGITFFFYWKDNFLCFER